MSLLLFGWDFIIAWKIKCHGRNVESFFSLKSSVLCLHDRVESLRATNEMKSGFILLFTIFSIENSSSRFIQPSHHQIPPNLIHGRYHWDYDCTQKVPKNLLFLLNWLFSASSPPPSSLWFCMHAHAMIKSHNNFHMYVGWNVRDYERTRKSFSYVENRESVTGTLWGAKEETRTTQRTLGTLGTARKIIKTFVSSTILWWFLANEFHAVFFLHSSAVVGSWAVFL